ncbi:MAG TPA: hypothetical protein PLP61_01795 [Nocardioides sp.]|uniref:hypothetical protein n=1 Tax=Nocardioides sp. TaxID=35761 RepID=UPI002CCCDBB1|nr:hypothetical protein [Nocardioides sp.]HQR25746.1 hypothetical protein [Nocardioides sp.]
MNFVLSFTPVLVVILTLAALALVGSVAVIAQTLLSHRTVRLARHESFASYYGHAFAH